MLRFHWVASCLVIPKKDATHGGAELLFLQSIVRKLINRDRLLQSAPSSRFQNPKSRISNLVYMRFPAFLDFAASLVPV